MARPNKNTWSDNNASFPLSAARMTNLETDLDSAYNQAFNGGGGSSGFPIGWYDVSNVAYGAKLDLTRSDGTTTSGSGSVTGGVYAASNGDVGKIVQVVGAGTVLLTNTNGSMNQTINGSQNILTGSGFTRALVGRYITVTGVGAAGATKIGRVWGVTDATHLRTTFDCNTTASSQTYTISDDLFAAVTASTATTLTLNTNAGRSITGAELWYATDDAAAIQAAIAAGEAATGNGYTLFIGRACGIGTGLVFSEPAVILGAGIAGYGAPVAHGSTRIRPLKPGLVCMTFGSSTTRMGVRGSITSGTATLTDPDANFVAGDVGKQIFVMGAATQLGSDTQDWMGAGSVVTIASRTNATTVVLSANAGTTVTDTIYSYGAGMVGYSFSGPQMEKIHIEGSANQKCGLHMMEVGGVRLTDCTISDFYSGVGLLSDRGNGANQYTRFNDLSVNYCYKGIVGFGSEFTFTGKNNLDGSGRVDLLPGVGTVGISSNNTYIMAAPTINVQGYETGLNFDGSGHVQFQQWSSECCTNALVFATDGFNGTKGARVQVQSMSNTSTGTTNFCTGLTLKAGVTQFAFDPGFYVEGDTKMYNGDATALAAIQPMVTPIVVKAGSVGDADFPHAPQDGAIGVDTLNNHFLIRLGGLWKFASLTGSANRVKKIGTAQQSSGSTTLVITCTGNTIPIGHHVAIAVGYGLGSTQTIAAADSRGNTYVKNIQADLNTGSTPHAAILIGRVTTALVAGDTITVTFGASVNLSDAIAYEYAGLASASWIDGTSIGATGTSTSPASGNDVTTNASDLLLSATYHAAATTTAGTNWTLVDSQDNVGTKRLDVQEQVVFATGTYTGTCTLSASVDWATVLVAAKAA